MDDDELPSSNQQAGFPTVAFLEIDGKVLSGEEFEEYCKDHGLCRRCARVRWRLP